MSYVKKAAAQKITLPSDKHYHVLWKPKVTYGALKEARTQAIQIDSDGTPHFDANIYAELSLLAHIDSWNLDDEDGQPLPLTLESVGLLDNEDVSLLNERMATESTAQEAARKNA